MLSSARLHVLEQIARHGTIAAAAESLGLTPSAVSHQLARFEDELGVSLVERGPRSIRLTVAGRRMAEHARSITAQMAEARDEVVEIGRGTAGRLRVGFFPSGGLRLLPTAMRHLIRDQPLVEVALFPGQTHELLPGLLDGGLDVAVVFEHSVDPIALPRGVQPHVLLDDPQFLVLPAWHRFADRGSVALEDLRDEPWIATTGMPPAPPLLDRLFARSGIVPDVRCRTDHYEVIVGLVRAGIGLGLVPRLGFAHWPPEDVAVLDLAGTAPSRRVFAATRESTSDPVVEAFLECLARAASEVTA